MSLQLDFDKLDWRKLVLPYTQPSLGRSFWQVINTLVPYFLLWGVMLWSLKVSYAITLLLSILAAGFLVRAFIIFHDCCHASFFKSHQGNDILGRILGVLTFTPYDHWRHDHSIHHATAGNLDKRGVGDVFTMTVQEYVQSPWWKRFAYRLMRNPLFLFTIGAPFVFIISHRFWALHTGRRERSSVIYTDLALLALFLVLGKILGYKEVILVQLPIIVIASTVGVWLFYVQHQFEGVYWDHNDSWSFVRAGLQGSSFYKLPAILQWFSGNIGFHHIHHLSPKIPNYFLPRCYKENTPFQIKPLTFLASFKSTRLHLWDEASRQLVGFDILVRRRKLEQL